MLAGCAPHSGSLSDRRAAERCVAHQAGFVGPAVDGVGFLVSASLAFGVDVVAECGAARGD